MVITNWNVGSTFSSVILPVNEIRYWLNEKTQQIIYTKKQHKAYKGQKLNTNYQRPAVNFYIYTGQKHLDMKRFLTWDKHIKSGMFVNNVSQIYISVFYTCSTTQTGLHMLVITVDKLF